MPAAEHFPLTVPQDARRALGAEALVHRVGRITRMAPATGRVLDLGAGGAALTLVKSFQARVVCVAQSEAETEALRAKLAGVGSDKVELKTLGAGPLPFSGPEFDVVLCLEKFWKPLEEALQALRPLLKSNGHLALLYPLGVGRQVPSQEWAKALGVPLKTPKECFQAFEKAGFEPIHIDSLSEEQVNEYFDAVEESLRRFPDPSSSADPLRAQLALRSRVQVAGLSFGCLVGRRREPDERPPAARDAG